MRNKKCRLLRSQQLTRAQHKQKEHIKERRKVGGLAFTNELQKANNLQAKSADKHKNEDEIVNTRQISGK